MCKGLLRILICMLLVFCVSVPVFAQNSDRVEVTEPADNSPILRKLTISTEAEFLEFAENCRLDSYSANLEVTLTADLNLKDTAFAGIPMFCGKFLGNDHTISGIHLAGDGSYQGLFRYITKDALVQNLVVEARIAPDGSRGFVGGIAGSNAGTIRNCDLISEISGGEYIGGITGENTVTGIVEQCHVEGDINGKHFVGGVAGINKGVIRDCANRGTVNTTAQQNTVGLTGITMASLTNSEAANTATDIGGIAGINTGVIRQCENHGNVGYRQMGYNVGGIAGTQSGYLTQSENFGTVQGRKEVGGIVGQMEPVTHVEFTADTLQVLQSQLVEMTNLVTRTSVNAQSNGAQMNNQIAVLQEQAQTAKDAVNAMTPSWENPFPDADTILAAQSTLSKTIADMPKTMQNIASAAQSTIAGITNDMNALAGIIGQMGQTINSATENLTGTITDISDLDTEDLLTGKAEDCFNYGDVAADRNVGGITGAITLERDLDVSENFDLTGATSLNYESEVRAVVLNCTNRGTVKANKQNVGGIVGWQALGLVKGSVNSGAVQASGADYVGGIAGCSTGYLRTCSANCEISGESYVGGIGGSACIVTDSIAKVQISDSRERMGAVLGWATQTQAEVETPIHGNVYLPAEKDYGAIDGISYDGLAQPMELEEFLKLENLPDTFKHVTIHFLYENGTEKEVLLPYGSDMTEDKIPELPIKEGASGIWEGLEQADLTDVVFDMTFRASYRTFSTTIESVQTRENGRPVVLVEGVFEETASVDAVTSEEGPVLTEEEILLESWRITTGQEATNARLLLPDETDRERLKVYLQGADGQWQEISYHISGSYLVFPINAAEFQVCLVQTQPDMESWMILAVAGVLLAGTVITVLAVRKHRKKKATAA